MNTYGRLRCFAALGGLAFPWGTPAMADEPKVSITTEYLMTVYLPKEAALSVDPSLSISRDPAGGWVRGKVSGRVLDPSALHGMPVDRNGGHLWAARSPILTDVYLDRVMAIRRPPAGNSFNRL